jgi:hypothetical protein
MKGNQSPKGKASEQPISGIHHVTAIASDPRRNLDFYTEVLGIRLVRRTVNFDDPGTYHRIRQSDFCVITPRLSRRYANRRWRIPSFVRTSSCRGCSRSGKPSSANADSSRLSGTRLMCVTSRRPPGAALIEEGVRGTSL